MTDRRTAASETSNEPKLSEAIRKLGSYTLQSGNRYSDWLRAGRPRFFSSPHRPDQFWGPTQPPTQWVPGALSPGVKRPGHEADHPPRTRAEVKNMSTLPYVFMANLPYLCNIDPNLEGQARFHSACFLSYCRVPTETV
jgi:hypothetical protein